ncbi:MAG: polyphenol oxidase family protein [Actinomycetaceae bacterium]|nr:polyphenol oxidase family protein [Actinomycetaceae bacterium]
MLEATGRVRFGFTRAITDPAIAGEALSIPNYGLNTDAPKDVVLSFREELRAKLGVPIVWMNQIHSDIVEVVDEANAGSANPITADAVVSRANVALVVQVADCTPVLLFDEEEGIIAACHAGRAGVEKSIVAKTVSEMVRLGSALSNITAAIGPCICGDCYEVGEDVYASAVALRPEIGARSRWGTPSLNIRAGVRKDLEGVGNIIEDDACTFESEDLNSYRRVRRCGRQLGIVMQVGESA